MNIIYQSMTNDKNSRIHLDPAVCSYILNYLILLSIPPERGLYDIRIFPHAGRQIRTDKIRRC